MCVEEWLLKRLTIMLLVGQIYRYPFPVMCLLNVESHICRRGGLQGGETNSATITVNVPLCIGNELAYVLYINSIIVYISLL